MSNTPAYFNLTTQKEEEITFLPPNLTPEKYVEYLDLNWDVFCAYAYSCYLKVGRGFVVVDWDNKLIENDWIKNNHQQNCGALYFKSWHLKKLFGDKWYNLSNSYTPEITLPLAIVWFEGEKRASIFRLFVKIERLSPLKAYERIGDRLSEFQIVKP